MPWARASSVGNGIACPASLVLADRLGGRPDAGKSDYVLEAADWGTCVHNWKATGRVEMVNGRANHVQLITDRINRAAGGPLPEQWQRFRAHWWPEGGRHEMTYAVDTQRFGRWAAFKGNKGQVDAWTLHLGPEWVKGEADYVGDAMGRVWVDDLKTGKEPTSPKDAQHGVYALGAWLEAGQPDEGVVASTTHWPRYPRDGRPTRDGLWATFSPEELLAFWQTLHETDNERQRLMALPTLQVMAAARPGEAQCRFCPARPACPNGYAKSDTYNGDEL